MTGYDHVLKAGDTSPAIERQLTDGADTPIDISGASVRFLMRPVADATPTVDAAATVVDAPTGVVRYDWTAGDTAAAGTYLGEFEVTYTDTTVETFPNAGYLDIHILEDL